MDRLTDVNQEQLDGWRTEHGVNPGDPVETDTDLNLKTDDHVMWYGFIPLIVYGPAPTAPGCFTGGYAPMFGDGIFPFSIADITDRIGPPPGSEGMPIYDEPEETP